MLSRLPLRFIRDKFKEPRIRTFLYTPASKPPGLNLKAQEGWTPQKYFKKIGGDTEEFHEKFETVQEIIDSKRWELKGKGIPPRQRKYILRITEYLRRGVLNFDMLEKRTAAPRKDEEK